MTRFEIGTAVGLAVAIIGGAVWIGMLEGRVRGLEDTKTIKEAKDRATEEIDSRLKDAAIPVIPSGVVVAFDSDDSECPEGWKPFTDGQSRMIIGASFESNNRNEGSSSNYRYRSYGGVEKVALETGHMPAHGHDYSDIYFSEITGQIKLPDGLGNQGGSDLDNKGHAREAKTEPTGRGLPHDNMPPYIALYFCEKN